MQPSLDNRIISAFLLYLDNAIQTKGLAYTNYSGLFYPVPCNINGLTAYAAPFKQLCNDTSVSGANILSGIYLNNNFVTIGQSGLYSINHYQGAVYFNTNLPKSTVISGNYAVKDFNIELTNLPEQKLLFDSKYVLNNQYNQTLTGLPLDTHTAPIIFIKTREQNQVPFALGAIDDNRIRFRAIVIANDEYQKTAVCGIIKSLHYHPMPFPTSTTFDALGNMTGINYNYTQLPLDNVYTPYIMDIRTIDVPVRGDFKDVLRNMAMIDINISTILFNPR